MTPRRSLGRASLGLLDSLWLLGPTSCVALHRAQPRRRALQPPALRPRGAPALGRVGLDGGWVPAARVGAAVGVVVGASLFVVGSPGPACYLLARRADDLAGAPMMLVASQSRTIDRVNAELRKRSAVPGAVALIQLHPRGDA